MLEETVSTKNLIWLFLVHGLLSGVNHVLQEKSDMSSLQILSSDFVCAGSTFLE